MSTVEKWVDGKEVKRVCREDCTAWTCVVSLPSISKIKDRFSAITFLGRVRLTPSADNFAKRFCRLAYRYRFRACVMSSVYVAKSTVTSVISAARSITFPKPTPTFVRSLRITILSSASTFNGGTITAQPVSARRDFIPSPRSPIRNRCWARGTSTVTAAVEAFSDLYLASIFSRTSAMRSRWPMRVICSSEEGW